jgi:hypothetical protein
LIGTAHTNALLLAVVKNAHAEPEQEIMAQQGLTRKQKRSAFGYLFLICIAVRINPSGFGWFLIMYLSPDNACFIYSASNIDFFITKINIKLIKREKTFYISGDIYPSLLK